MAVKINREYGLEFEPIGKRLMFAQVFHRAPCNWGSVLLYFLGLRRAGVAQLVEHLICNQRVGGSNPSASSAKIFWSGEESQMIAGGRFLRREECVFVSM